MGPAPSSRWIAFRKAQPSAKVRLLCLPFAGGSALAYRDWARTLPETIEVCPIELPGRGTRFADPHIETIDRLVDAILDGVAPLIAEPFALFGHSMGAHIALELARRSPTQPLHLFASGSPAPHLDREPLGGQTDAKLVEMLQNLGGTPAEVLANRELMELALPTLRADLRLLDSYCGMPSPTLAFPLTVFAGTRDKDIPIARAHAWGGYTESAFRLVEVEGEHFFLTEPRGREVVLREVARTLAPLTP